MFRGTFTVKVDDKGRLKLPTLVKQRLDEKYGPTPLFFVTSFSGDVVHVYPLGEWEHIEERLSQAPQFDKLKRRFLFYANHYGAEASLDDQGRLLLPSKLRDEAGMKGEVMLSWQSNHVEIFSQGRYQTELEGYRLTGEDFENLSKLGI